MNKNKQRISGLSVMEVMLAIAIMMMLLPFVYKQISKQTEDAQNVVIAKNIEEMANVSENYIKVNEKNWAKDYKEVLDGYILFTKMQDYGLRLPVATYPDYFGTIFLSIEKKQGETKDIKMEAYLIYTLNDTVSDVRAWKIVSAIGDKAGFLRDGVLEGYQGSWKVEGFNVQGQRAIVMRISYLDVYRDIKRYLYSNEVDKNSAYNTMENDLFMGVENLRYNIDGVKTLYGMSVVFDTIYVASLLFKDIGDLTQLYAKRVEFKTGLDVGYLNLKRLETDGNIDGKFEEFNFETLLVNQMQVDTLNLKKGMGNDAYISNIRYEVMDNMDAFTSCDIDITKGINFDDISSVVINNIDIKNPSVVNKDSVCSVEKDVNYGLVILRDNSGSSYYIHPDGIVRNEDGDEINNDDLYAECGQTMEEISGAGIIAVKRINFTKLSTETNDDSLLQSQNAPSENNRLVLYINIKGLNVNNSNVLTEINEILEEDY